MKHLQFIGGWGPPLGEKGSDPNYLHWAGKWDMWIHFRGPRKESEDKPCTVFLISAPVGSNLGAQAMLSEVVGMKSALMKHYS